MTGIDQNDAERITDGWSVRGSKQEERTFDSLNVVRS
jgi:hypothetical protein